MPTIRLRLAHGQQSSSGMDAAGQGEFDLTPGQLSMARNSGPCCGCSWPAAERQGDQLAERLLPEEPSSTYFSDGRRMDCLWAAAVSDRNGEASVERRASVVWRASVIRPRVGFWRTAERPRAQAISCMLRGGQRIGKTRQPASLQATQSSLFCPKRGVLHANRGASGCGANIICQIC